jgi:hypoxanthine phosphoribosyltransferase
MGMKSELKIVYGRDEIAASIKRLAGEIERDYRAKNPVLIGILKSSFIFMSDLVREMDFPLEVEFVRLSSYKNGTISSGRVEIIQDIVCDVFGRHVLIVEDIVDTGRTVKYLLDSLKARDPASVKVCVLADKPSGHKYNVDINYFGFNAPDKFLVGYGLDLNERYRNLPDIYYIESGK